jgi:hypothetical protein
MRRTLTAALVLSPLMLTSIAPAQAAGLSSQQVSSAYSIMMTRGEAEQLGVTKQMISYFGVARSDKGTPDAPWLCDLTGETQVEGNGAKNLVSMEYLSLEGTAVGNTSQEVHVYGSAAQAKKAYDGIVNRVKRCEGQQQPAADTDTEGGGGITLQLTNGTKSAKDGDAFLWVRSNTTTPGPDGFASHEYLTVRHFGNYLQIIEVESEGNNAKDLTAKQIRITDRLTDALGDRWQASFR